MMCIEKTLKKVNLVKASYSVIRSHYSILTKPFQIFPKVMPNTNFKFAEKKIKVDLQKNASCYL